MLKKTLLLAAVAALATCQPIHAAILNWANTGIDFNAGASYTPTTTPTTTSVTAFTGTETTVPNVTANVTIAGINFSGTGYDITSTGGFTLGLNGYGTSGTGTSSGTVPAIYDSSAGTNTVDTALTLAPGGSGNTSSSFYNTGSGSLIVNGNIGGSTINLSLRGGGIIQLGGTNTFATASIDAAGVTAVLANNSALGNGTFTINNTSSLQASAARSIANAVVLGGNTTIGGSNNINFTGSVTSSGSSSRTLTVSNSGTTTISGNLYLAPDNTTARGLSIGGTTALSISAPIANNSGGNTVASPLTYNGSSTLTLSGANTYTGTTSVGGTSITGSMLTVTSGGTLGSGNVTIYGGNTLTLGVGVTNAIADSAMLTLGTITTAANAILALNGTAGTSQETVNTLSVNGIGMAAGTYGPIGDLAANFQLPNITGTGELTVLTTSTVPEPSTWAMAAVGAGLLGLSMRRYRRRQA